MSNVKRYKVKHEWNDEMEVIVEADLDTLTSEKANLINEFWGDSGPRKAQQKGDVQQAVIRLFGAGALSTILAEGGAFFGPLSPAGEVWSKQLRAEEGWGGADPEDEANPYGWCGLRIIKASVGAPSFDDVNLTEVA